MRALVVVPAFNEEEALGAVLDEVRAHEVPGWTLDVLVVDDGSVDGTARVARAHGCRVLHLCRNQGIGAAVQSGLRVAHREGYDCAIQLDGDGPHPASELEHLLARASTAPVPDLVVGTRFGDKASFRSTLLRRLGMWWLCLVLRVVAGVRTTDPTSGFRVYGKRALRLFDSSYPYDFPEPEALAMARAAGLTVAETPVVMRARQGGVSSIDAIAAAYYMLKVTLAVILAYVRSRRWRLEEA
jgi:glycosyltransferase involved in cell wall biosynthesis